MTDYSVECRVGIAVLQGVFRLETPEAYDRVFGPVSEGLAASPSGYTVDLTDVVLMNSSGIRALGDMVLRARTAGTPLVFCGKADVPWQKKTVASLQPLYEGLTVKLR